MSAQGCDRSTLPVVSASPQPIPLGSGRYEIRNLASLGSGNFGHVYVGWDTHLDQQVAIKLLPAGSAPDAALIEARAQRRLSEHPHVVTVRDVVVEPPQPFIVLDYIAGGSVGDQLDAGSVSVVEAVRWTRDGLAGLAHAHSLGIYHRDYKPGNLLLLDNGGAALADFGLAEDTVRAAVASPLIYTPHAAPELASQGTSEATEVWAVGCTLYRLLTGEYPFADAAAARRGEYVLPDRLNPQVPRDLQGVVARALEIDPDDRFQTAVDMRTALLNCPIRHAWNEISDPNAAECWEAETARGTVRVRLVERPRGAIELSAHRDLGSGLRRLRLERPTSLARGRQRLRTWLRTVVEGGEL
jgi:serine/threonine protein kinase